MAASPGYGHVRPIKALALALHKLGYPITFLAAPMFKASIESTGVEFVSFGGKATLTHHDINTAHPERLKLGKGPEMVIYDTEHIFIAPMADHYAAFQSILNRESLRDKKVVIVSDSTIAGLMPMLLGAPGRRVPIIAIGPMPILVMSKDTPPFGTAMPSQGEEKNLAMNEGVKQVFAPIDLVLQRHLREHGCPIERPSDFVFDNFYLTPDLYLQLCVPSLEPPRRDLPSNIRFIGTVLGSNDQGVQPEWFDSFIVQESAKPLVFVTSGSLPTMSFSELIEPTLKACADLPVRVVACTVAAKPPADFVAPDNARIAEWISFDALLPHTDIVVSNGGYGTLSQSFAAGVPMVLAGMTEDKSECCARAAATGAAINLRTQTPTEAQVKEALLEMLIRRDFKKRATQLKEEYARHDAVKAVVEAIDEMNAKDFSNGTI